MTIKRSGSRSGTCCSFSLYFLIRRCISSRCLAPSSNSLLHSLNQCVSSVSEMQHRVCFQIIPVMIEGKPSSQSLRIDFQISDAQCLKEEAPLFLEKHQRRFAFLRHFVLYFCAISFCIFAVFCFIFLRYFVLCFCGILFCIFAILYLP